jgi:hypothetical protein
MGVPYPIYSNAGGAGCKAKCDVLYGDVAKAKCHTQYIKVPCTWNCSKHPDKPCCKHNKQVPINIANCKKNVDAKRASCKAECDLKAGAGAGGNEPTSPPEEPIKDEAPVDTTNSDSGNGNNSGSGAKKNVDGKKILLYSGIAIAGIAGISLLVWGVGSAIKGN